MTSAPPSPAVRDGGTDWHRLHLATPFIKSWGVIAAFAAFAAYRLSDDIEGTIRGASKIGWPRLALGIAIVLILVFVWAFIWWRRAHFRITDTSLELATGVIFRQRRTVRLDRVEAVDTVRPLVPRLFGLVKLKIESAGGSGSAVELAYLKMSDAARWRRAVLERAASARLDDLNDPASKAGTGAATASSARPDDLGDPTTTAAAVRLDSRGDSATKAGTAPATAGAARLDELDSAAQIPAASAASVREGPIQPPRAAPATPGDEGAGGTGQAASSMGVTKSAETEVGEFLGDADADAPELFAVPTVRVIGVLALSPMTWLMILAIIGGVVVLIANGPKNAFYVVPGLLGLGSYVWSQFIGGFGFSAKQTARGLTLSHGLTTRVSQTIAPGRVVAIELQQGPLWRRLSWWKAQMNVAGYGSDDAEKQSVLVPVGDSETIRRAVWAVAPELAQPGDWELVTAAMTGKGPTAGFTGSPRRARLFDPLAWKRTAFAVTSQMLVLRLGAIWRRATMVPHARIQGLELWEGPWARRRHLASVTINSPKGPVTPVINHLDRADALALMAGESARLNAALPSGAPATADHAPDGIGQRVT
ncbi:MAG: PH domain-containing protein [Bifidobacteriaceae bacterium]|nr:PH domain-containing protein [Bifidobacteriaceae bacterium]